MSASGHEADNVIGHAKRKLKVAKRHAAQANAVLSTACKTNKKIEHTKTSADADIFN